MNNQRGSLTIGAMVLGVVMTMVVVFGVNQYQRNLKLYEQGPKAVTRDRTSQLQKSIRRQRLFDSPTAAHAVPTFTLLGGLKNRHIVHKEIPAYPTWAEKEGVSGDVRLAFRVNEAGEVYPNIWVTQTMGHSDFDEAAIQALRHWRFAPLDLPEQEVKLQEVPVEPYPGQAGMIQFNFTLSNQPIRS